ncbi:MAG: DUF167 domain-containing protein [Cyanobacteria bacterium REEB65]|nr:DUF167 domain-containing protein [Cyanobacteria bacterium REEB65]
MPAFEPRQGGLRIHVRVQPRASRSEVVGLAGDRLKLRISAPPVDGAANEACRDLLAALLTVPKGAVSLVTGAKGREKTFEIMGDPALLEARLQDAMAR